MELYIDLYLYMTSLLETLTALSFPFPPFPLFCFLNFFFYVFLSSYGNGRTDKILSIC